MSEPIQPVAPGPLPSGHSRRKLTRLAVTPWILAPVSYLGLCLAFAWLYIQPSFPRFMLLLGAFIPPALSLYLARRVNDHSADRWRVREGEVLLAGMVIVVLFLVCIAIPNFLEAQVRAKHSRVQTDMRSVSATIEKYFTDQSVYPDSAAGRASVNGQFCKHPDLLRLPTFRYVSDEELHRAYSSSRLPLRAYSGAVEYPVDPFSPEKRSKLVYHSAFAGGIFGYILLSAGPDGDFDIDPFSFDPSRLQPWPELLVLTYDPTNGLLTNGDIWRMAFRQNGATKAKAFESPPTFW